MQPTRKTSKGRTRSKRAHRALKATRSSACPKCSQAKLPHAACANCGYVNPRMTLKLGKNKEE